MTYYIRDLGLFPQFYETSEECINDINRFKSDMYNIEQLILASFSFEEKFNLIIIYEDIENNYLNHAINSLELIFKLKYFPLKF